MFLIRYGYNRFVADVVMNICRMIEVEVQYREFICYNWVNLGTRSCQEGLTCKVFVVHLNLMLLIMKQYLSVIEEIMEGHFF